MFSKIKDDYLFYLSRQLNEALVKPDMLQIMITAQCNLQCKMCGVWQQKFQGEMTTDDVKRLIDQAIDFGIKMIYFTGGEALLRRDIFELINYAARPGIVTTVNTNGSIITDKMAEKICMSSLRSLGISIDSPVAEIHNHIRGAGVFEKAVAGVEKINSYKKHFSAKKSTASSHELGLSMISVISKLNIDHLVDLVYFAEKLGCCYLALQPLISNENLLDNKGPQSELWPDPGDIVRLEAVFKELTLLREEKLRQRGIMVDFMPEKTIQHYHRSRKVNTCFAGYNRIFINPQGDISFVCFDAFGNIKTDLLEKAWLSEKAFEIRKKILECQVNCTQFCSERQDSGNLEEIHARALCMGREVAAEESIFLSGIAAMLKEKTVQGERVQKTLKDVESIIRSMEGHP